jgi:glucose-6-phosphate-specific signal transduction histidine kinase
VAKYAEATEGGGEPGAGRRASRFASSTTGTGFDTAETSYGTGVQGMADRLDAIGGALQVDSRKGEGTTIEGRIPTPVDGDPLPSD